ncbi:MAG: hypothetical protein QMD09_11470, partial [Desulfatibacillaceae bacterium]|nr:hypothetical protein [Desulfatibacillaceae bacterium]
MADKKYIYCGWNKTTSSHVNELLHFCEFCRISTFCRPWYPCEPYNFCELCELCEFSELFQFGYKDIRSLLYNVGVNFDNNLYRPINIILSNISKNNYSCENSCYLIVVQPRSTDPYYSVDELAFFSRGLGGDHKKVLYIHLSESTPLTDGKINDWLFVVKNTEYDNDQLKKWLDEDLKTHHNTNPCCNNYETWKSLFLKQLNNLKKNKVELASLTSELAKSSSKLIFDYKMLSALFFGLHRIKGRFARLEHDLRKKSDDPNANAKRRILNTCVALHDAMVLSVFPSFGREKDTDKKTSAGSPTQASLHENGKGKSTRIDPPIDCLLIDDRPEDFAKELAGIIKKTTNLNLYVWNPSATRADGSDKGHLELEDLEKYTSMDTAGEDDHNSASGTACSCPPEASGNRIGEKILKLKPYIDKPPDQDLDTNLQKCLQQVKFIFVDILLRNRTGRESERGLKVINGLHRLCRDLLHDNEEDDGKKSPLPGFIAISRAEDIDTVQKAIMAGAGGYVIKSNLLGVSTALLAVMRQSPEGAGTASRNFRPLYRLPHETMGLLRRITVPRALKFHNKDSYSNNSDAQIPFARLLAAIPKPNLHVHAGSCMHPEFLVAASLVMLSRHSNNQGDTISKKMNGVIDFWRRLNTWEKQGAYFDAQLIPEIQPLLYGDYSLPYSDNQFIVSKVANKIREIVSSAHNESKEYDALRSALYKSLNVPDYYDKQKLIECLKDKQDLSLFLFAIKHSTGLINLTYCDLIYFNKNNYSTETPCDINDDDATQVF